MRADRRPPVRLLLLTIVAVLAAGTTTALTRERTASPAVAVVSSPTVLGARTGFSPGAGILAEDVAELNRELDLLVSSGAAWIRLDVDWSQVERRRGTLDWTATDRVIDAARARALDVVALVTYTPSWARPPGTSSHAPPDDPAAFAAFAAQAAERYRPRGVRTFEIWNEPNIPQFWEPSPDPDAYVVLLRAAAEAVRASAPDATVLSGGLAPADDRGPGGQIDPRTFVSAMYERDAGPSFDAVAVHPYSFPALASDVATAEFNTFQKLPAIRSTMLEQGDGAKQIWLTEVGAPTGRAPGAVSAERQTELLLDVLDSAAALPYVGPLFLYALRDAGTDVADREDNFGLVERDFTVKPAYPALVRRLSRRTGSPAAEPGAG